MKNLFLFAILLSLSLCPAQLLAQSGRRTTEPPKPGPKTQTPTQSQTPQSSEAEGVSDSRLPTGGETVPIVYLTSSDARVAADRTLARKATSRAITLSTANMLRM